MPNCVSSTTLRCDQAIFTSVRTPMGEGYRIIAASKGLRQGERQTITRFSPSHDALCSGAEKGGQTVGGIRGLAFYPLPSGRLCVAHSCFAGDEHTGRGGKRIYTRNLIFEAQDFPGCTYNGFAVSRALLGTQDAAPQLNPPSVLPELHLPITESALKVGRIVLDPVLGRGWRSHILQALLEGRSVIVNVPQDWFDAAEALVLAIPGPMRESISLGAGLKFSFARCHRLSLLCDSHGAAKIRVAGQAVEYIDPTCSSKPRAAPKNGKGDIRAESTWTAFVERHWSAGDTPGLARRTSRAFTDLSVACRERIGRAYNQIDTLPQTDWGEILRIAGEHLSAPGEGVEGELIAQLLAESQGMLATRLCELSWDEAGKHWSSLCRIWWQSPKAREFAVPLIEQALRCAARKHAIVAAEAALEFAGMLPARSNRKSAVGPTMTETEIDRLIAGALECLVQWVEHASDAEFAPVTPRLDALIQRCHALRPRCPSLERIRLRRPALSVPTS